MHTIHPAKYKKAMIDQIEECDITNCNVQNACLTCFDYKHAGIYKPNNLVLPIFEFENSASSKRKKYSKIKQGFELTT